MAQMRETVRLGGKPRHDPAMLFGIEIGLNDVADEIAPCLCRCRFYCHLRFPVRDQRPFCQIPRLPPSPGKILGKVRFKARFRGLIKGFWLQGFSYVSFLLYTSAPYACPLSPRSAPA